MRTGLEKCNVSRLVKATLLAGLISAGPAALAGELLEPESLRMPLLKRDAFEDDYEYNFEERNLTLGVNLGGGLVQGSAINAFPVGGTVTPYFKGAFGDGNALEVDLTLGYSPVSGANAPWLFFRTPRMGGMLWGYVASVAPTVAFKYDIEFTSSISRKAKVLGTTGVGVGPLLTYGQASLTANGTVPDTNLSNMGLFFDLVPSLGLKFRMGKFAYFEVGARAHILWHLTSNVNNTGWSSGTPQSIPEFWLGNYRYFDTFLGFSFDVG